MTSTTSWSSLTLSLTNLNPLYNMLIHLVLAHTLSTLALTRLQRTTITNSNILSYFPDSGVFIKLPLKCLCSIYFLLSLFPYFYIIVIVDFKERGFIALLLFFSVISLYISYIIVIWGAITTLFVCYLFEAISCYFELFGYLLTICFRYFL